MEFDVFRVSQRGGWESFEIYVSVLMAQEVIDRCAIDRWTPQNQGATRGSPSLASSRRGEAMPCARGRWAASRPRSS